MNDLNIMKKLLSFKIQNRNDALSLLYQWQFVHFIAFHINWHVSSVKVHVENLVVILSNAFWRNFQMIITVMHEEIPLVENVDIMSTLLWLINYVSIWKSYVIILKLNALRIQIMINYQMV